MYSGGVPRRTHIVILAFCVREIFRIISPKSIKLPETTRGQESLEQCNNYGATSTAFIVSKKNPVTKTI